MHHHDSVPSAAPIPVTRPKLITGERTLAVTPEKTVKVVKDGRRKKEKKVNKKVTFNENQPKDLYEECPLAHPVINSTSRITQEIEKNRQETLDLSSVLKEIQLSDSVQSALNDEVTAVLNYKTTDRKYQNLPTLDVQKENIIPQTRRKFKERPKDLKLKPHVMDLYFHEDFQPEQTNIDFQIDLRRDEENDTIFQENFEYLFDLYRCQELIPDTDNI